jgi:hypothetical protein
MSLSPMSLSEPADSRRDLAGSLTLSLVWLFVTAVGLLLTPDPHGHGTHQRLGLPPCPSVVLFDRPCPGCGLTTSWTSLLHGDFAMAFHAHALGPILYLGYSAFAISTLWMFWRKRRWRDGRWINPALIALFAVFFAYGMVRMAVTPHYAMATERALQSLVGGG